MAETVWDKTQLEGFRAAARSLKLYRRAELEDEQQQLLIKDLYVDPLPEEHIFQTVLKPNTTFLIGRKGTGKSTIFQRVQYELRRMKGYASAYVDIKTVFEASSSDPALLSQLGSDTLGPLEIQNLRLYRAFIKAVIAAIKDDVGRKLRESRWEWIKDTFTASSDELFESLDELLERADEAEFTTVLGIKREQLQQGSESTEGAVSGSAIGANISGAPGVTTSAYRATSSELKLGSRVSYGDVLIRVFNIKEVLLRLKEILNRVGIKHLFVFVDDFSELPQEAMTVVVDTLLAPLEQLV